MNTPPRAHYDTPAKPPPYPNTRLGRLTAILEQHFGRQQRWSRKSPMDQLIATILSQRTNYADERTAFNNLLAAFGNWAGVAQASVAEIEAQIQTSNYPEVKAPRIKEVISTIIEEQGEASLDHLYDLSIEQADAYLRRLPGVGPKTSTFIQLFSMRRPVLPVDTHVHRTTTRIGIIPLKTSQAKAHDLLLSMIPAEASEVLNFHKLYFKLGQRICTYSRPRCGDCPLAFDCDYARQNHPEVVARTQAVEDESASQQVPPGQQKQVENEAV